MLRMKKNGKKIGLVLGAVGVIAVIAVLAVVLVFVFGKKEESYRNIRVSEVTGEVIVNRDGMEGLEAYTNMNLLSGDEIVTEKGAQVTLRLDEDKYVVLDEESKITLHATGSAKDSKTKLQLEYGAVFSDIKNKLSADSGYEVVTPASTMSVRGTQFEVVYRENKVKVLTYEGAVLVVPEGSEEGRTVNAGEWDEVIETAEGEYQFDGEVKKIEEKDVGGFISEYIKESGIVFEKKNDSTENSAPTVASTLTPEPTKAVTAAPTVTPEPTKAVTAAPTVTSEPTKAVTVMPTPSPEPTKAPTAIPTPSPEPTKAPTVAPTPTTEPAKVPTVEPTPTTEPTKVPTVAPTPTTEPTKAPMVALTPTTEPTKAPTVAPTPTTEPTKAPTVAPTPTIEPTKIPTKAPTVALTPTTEPTKAPTVAPTPTTEPTKAPTAIPTPTTEPTKAPTVIPTPTTEPTKAPTAIPTPTTEPTKAPTVALTPTTEPTKAPTAIPTPTTEPTKAPTVAPTPTTEPTKAPTVAPTPTTEPTKAPTVAPTPTPTSTPTPTLVPENGECEIRYYIPNPPRVLLPAENSYTISYADNMLILGAGEYSESYAADIKPYAKDICSLNTDVSSFVINATNEYLPTALAERLAEYGGESQVDCYGWFDITQTMWFDWEKVIDETMLADGGLNLYPAYTVQIPAQLEGAKPDEISCVPVVIAVEETDEIFCLNLPAGARLKCVSQNGNVLKWKTNGTETDAISAGHGIISLFSLSVTK